ncbi:MAG: hypothetical protein ACR2H5_25115, partial [Ktedonobacteraceae bacterium]
RIQPIVKRLSHTVQYSTFLGRLQVLPKNNSVPYIPMSLRQGAYGTYAKGFCYTVPASRASG